MIWFSDDSALDASQDEVSCGLPVSGTTLDPGYATAATFNSNVFGHSGAYIVYQVDRSDPVAERDENNNVLSLPYSGYRYRLWSPFAPANL